MTRLSPSQWTKVHAFLYVVLLVALTSATLANNERNPYEKQNTERLLEEKAIGFLNELTARRRVTTLFPNFQTSQHGVQEKFVNTSTGNLTFLVRDLVVAESMPIVMGRVYDSAIQDDSDFGPGWKLSVREEVLRDGGTLTFIDSSNSEYVLNVQQNTIVPTRPALSPVDEGSLTWDSSLDGHRLTLRSSKLVREFELIGDRYRLVKISNGNGSLSLEYSDELIDRIVSGDSEMSIERDSNRQIESISDNHGRTVRYAYNDDGSLSWVIDRSDATWSYDYDQGQPGLLQEMVDPRGETMLQATYSKERRATWVQVLDQEANFEYLNSSTAVVDKLNRKTMFERESNGLTSGIVNPAGDATRVLFDDEFRPVEMVRNGTTIARISYDGQGRMRSMSTESGNTTYGHGKHGVVAVSGTQSAQYEYDSAGRLVKASDKFGQREYEHAKQDQKFVLSSRAKRLELRANEIGLVTRIIQDRRSPVELSYDGIGRVASISSQSFPNASYTYDERGLRESSGYGRAFSSQLSYDEVGNLIRHSISNSEGKTSTQKYTLDANNRVKRINSEDGDSNIEVTLNYDEVGRLRTAYTNGRSMSVQYDILDRAELVQLDGEPVVARSYRHDEPDLIVSGDSRTTLATTTGHVSPVFGSVDSILYTRPSPTIFGLIGYNGELKSFEVHEDAMVPDIVFLSSVQSRQIPLDGSQIKGGPFQFDKPSNALFLPAEFRSVNCEVCVALIIAVSMKVTQPSSGPGSLVKIRVTIWGWCTSVGSSNAEGQITLLPWTHKVNWGGRKREEKSSSNTIELENKFDEAGMYFVTDTVECSTCPHLLATRTKHRLVGVPGDCTLTQQERDDFAKSLGDNIASNPWEEGMTFNCYGQSKWAWDYTNSNPANDSNADPCATTIVGGLQSTIAGLHSHPWFTEASEMDEGVGCREVQDHTEKQRIDFNEEAGIFSDGDKSWVKSNKKPLYLVYGPEGDRKMRVLEVDMTVRDLEEE